MTNGKRRWLGLAIVPLTLLMLGVATPAQANHLPPTHKCDGDPNFPFLNEVFTRDENNPESGRIIVLRNDGQDCVISANDIHAELEIEIRVENGGKLSIPNALNIRSLGGNVTLTATGNDIDAPNADVKANNLIDIQAGVEDGTVLGSIDVKDVISNFADSIVGDMNILIRAQSDLSIGKVKTNGDQGVNSERSGNVQIDANLNPINTGDISIGAGGSIEEIDIRSKTGGEDEFGNPSPFKVEIGMRVENGTDNSTGNITVNDLGAIKVTQSQSRSGRLELNANKGDLILGGGTLDASQTDFGGGNIYLFGEKVTFSGAATIDNSQSDNAPKTARQIIIAASEIDYSAGNLNIFSDGSGLSDNAPATVYFLPSGGIISNSTNNVLSLEHSVQFNGNFFFFPGQVHFNGGTGSDLTLRADGEHIQVAITGDNIVFDGKDVTIQARGRNNTKHEIVMGFFDFGSYDGTKGLQMNNTGVTLFNVRGFGATNSGGDIQIQVDKSDLNVGRWNLRANGGANQGDGGTILYTTSEMILSTNTLVDFEADAALNGVGNAQILRPTNGRKAIFLNAGNSDLILGRNKEKIQMSANGGGQGGNGGAIEVVSNGEILMDRSDAVTASVQGPDGFGGHVKINGGAISFFNANGVEINVDGGMTSGNGGVIELLSSLGGSIDVDGTALGVTLSAKAPGDGNGGLIVFDNISSVNIDSGHLDVSAAGNNGQGGNLFVFNSNSVHLTGGDINANGSGNGKGGIVSIQTANFSSANTIISANGGNGNSNGGEIAIRNISASQPLNFGSINTLVFSAIGNGTGEGGKVTIERATGLTNLHTIIKVDGGSLVTNVNTNFGRIVLNGVTARQWKTGFSTWPTTYWNSYAPEINDMTMANAANFNTLPKVKTMLQNRGVQIYHMNDVVQWNSFLGRSDATAGVIGYSLELTRISALFDKLNGVDIAVVSGVPTRKAGVTVHEIGHQFDYAMANISQQFGPDTFPTKVSDDFQPSSSFNTTACPAVLSQAVCTNFPGPLNSQKLFQYDPTLNNYELFANMYQEISSPGDGDPVVENAMFHMSDTFDWMFNLLMTLP